MSYAAEVLADSPDLYWRLGEASGTTAQDATANNNDGTYVNTPTLGVTGLLTGDADTAVTFNGTDEYVNGGNPGAWFAGDFTVECWFKTTTASAFAVLVSKYDGINDDGWIGYLSSGKLTMDVAGVGGLVQSPLTYNDNAVHHVVFLRRGAVWEIWADGGVVAGDETFGSTDESSAAAFTVAKWNDGASGYFPGTIDEVAVYDGTALGQARIRAHAMAGGLTANGLSEGSTYTLRFELASDYDQGVGSNTQALVQIGTLGAGSHTNLGTVRALNRDSDLTVAEWLEFSFDVDAYFDPLDTEILFRWNSGDTSHFRRVRVEGTSRAYYGQFPQGYPYNAGDADGVMATPELGMGYEGGTGARQLSKQTGTIGVTGLADVTWYFAPIGPFPLCLFPRNDDLDSPLLPQFHDSSERSVRLGGGDTYA